MRAVFPSVTVPAVLAAMIALAPARPAVAAVDVVVDGDQRYQTIEGFGTCLISWIPAMTEFYRTEDAQRMYAEELGMSMLRVALGGGIERTEDWREISHEDFRFPDPDRGMAPFVDFAKGIKRINPDIKIIGSVWSPPAWMKVNESTTDERSGALTINMATEYMSNRGEIFNRVKREYYRHFAKWMVEMVKYFDAQGIPLYAISPANEPQFTQTFGSCVWNGEDYATIVAMIGELLDHEGLGHVKIFGPEGMTFRNGPGAFNPVYIGELRKNESAWRQLDVFATHGYVDGFIEDQSANASAGFRELIKDTGKPFWITEGGTGPHEWPAPLVDGIGPAAHNALVAGHVSAFLPWQFAEDAANTHQIMPVQGPSKKTYVIRQFTRYIPAGSVRVDATPEFGTVSTSAYVHDEAGLVTMVLFNTADADETANVTLTGEGVAGAEQLNVVRTSATEDGRTLEPVEVSDEGTCTVELPAMSIVTLTTGRP